MLAAYVFMWLIVLFFLCVLLRFDTLIPELCLGSFVNKVPQLRILNSLFFLYQVKYFEPAILSFQSSPT